MFVSEVERLVTSISPMRWLICVAGSVHLSLEWETRLHLVTCVAIVR